MIVVVDYGMGNLRSVEKGFLKVGVTAKVTSHARDIDNAHAVVLPGVGAFKDCMANLAQHGLAEAVVRAIEKGKPFLGICLGLQLLMTESEEFGLCKGLNVVQGRVVRFPTQELKVPHMGWNTVELSRRPPLFEGIEDRQYFYFVHSYYVDAKEPDVIAGRTAYGVEFTSMIWKDNVIATQFHPEKSHRNGLKILHNFSRFAAKH